MSFEDKIEYKNNAEVTDEHLNELFSASWPNHQPSSFRMVLSLSLVYVCAFRATELIGYVNVAWDGRSHAFILDPTVHPRYRRQGIGQQLVLSAIAAAREHGVAWMHVDFEPHLREFYAQCGFRASEAGIVNLAG
ncbi:GNAT family N-acetyltransferase [Cupriavidus basilensis]|uniref:GNAT family N-acetyltransferase n=1 Tax=Cupriavidus basilensis TaxID=68895 RepID=A0ABT6ASU8_9BURK|nr:GNAT family N-acetyltransferase [Cupriavidus basilensis]MDF3835700.1 GNAT family N-acetyltransferase [Cupriavidus basilensis]